MFRSTKILICDSPETFARPKTLLATLSSSQVNPVIESFNWHLLYSMLKPLNYINWNKIQNFKRANHLILLNIDNYYECQNSSLCILPCISNTTANRDWAVKLIILYDKQNKWGFIKSIVMEKHSLLFVPNSACINVDNSNKYTISLEGPRTWMASPLFSFCKTCENN